jgi:type IV pilus assembly protein PilB
MEKSGHRSLENIGQEMVNAKLISQDQLAVALETKKNLGGDLGSILIRKRFVTEEQIRDFLQHHLKIPFIALKDYVVDPDITKIVPISLAQKYHFMPLSCEKDTLTIAMVNPMDVFAIDDIHAQLKLQIQPVLASAAEVDHFLQQSYRIKEMDEEATLEDVQIVQEGIEVADSGAERLKEMASGTKVIEEVNRIIHGAARKRASDIHIEPLSKTVRMRYRIDGFLEERLVLPRQMHLPIVTRIKIMSGMDIAERRIPQDGRVRLKILGTPIDMRVSTYPTMYGEKVVIRLLTREAILSVGDLGFSERDRKCFEEIIARPHGVFLVTGPTGSGKTTTLYAALQRINSQERNIISIEDPIENEIVGINQAQINPKAGLTFASALRSILRQDPDVIMVGEIRDQETADIVVRAAITGHLVFSTLHTNTAVGAVTRLADLGVERFLISSGVIGLLAQRLVRKICPECRQVAEGEPAKLTALSIDPNATLHRGKGCEHCRMSGYFGRLGIFELVVMTPQLREMVLRSASEDELRQASKQEGTLEIRDAGVKKVLEGLTTVDEILRVTEES